jgi:protein arginine N-methyltransferase 1
MPHNRLQRLSVGAFSVLRRGMARLRASLHSRPGLEAWVYPQASKTPEASYREYNGWVFGHFGEQERMLADRRRMDFYHAAISRHIRPGDRVIDLGTGTGILAAFASRAGAAKVYAIDHSRILRRARKLAAHNAVENVEFIATHSKDFGLKERVDVILHEQMGDWLFNEAMVANVIDLRDRLLKPGGRILPSRFELYCEPVKLKDERHVPFLWELNVHGYDYSCLDRNRPQEPGYYHQHGSDLGLVECFLGRPEPALAFDLETLVEGDMPRELHFSRRISTPGRMDGLAVYFCVRLDGDMELSSSPLDPNRAPHWGFLVLRTDREDFREGDVIDITLRAERWQEPDSWRWSHARRAVPVSGS